MRILAMALASALILAPAAGQAAPISDQVKKALATLNRVVGHTQRLIDAKNYTRLPHENGEFQEGAEALEKGIAAEPAAFKAKIDVLLKNAEAASQSVADAADAHSDAKLVSTHAVFAASVSKVLAAFPADAQPAPPAQ